MPSVFVTTLQAFVPVLANTGNRSYWIPACAGMTDRKSGGEIPYPASPAAIFTLMAMMNTLKKNAITLCISATRRR